MKPRQLSARNELNGGHRKRKNKLLRLSKSEITVTAQKGKFPVLNIVFQVMSSELRVDLENEN